jgi:hypothetical protein
VSTIENTDAYPVPGTTKEGEVENGEVEGLWGYRAAAGGDAVAYMGDSPASGVGGSGATGNGDGNQYISTRSPNGWDAQATDVATNAGEYSFRTDTFSTDLSVQIIRTEEPGFVQAQGGSRECYEEQRGVLFSHTAAGYRPLDTVAGFCGGVVLGVSANGTHAIFGKEHAALYDSVGGQTYAVSVLPNGESDSTEDAVLGGFLLGEPEGSPYESPGPYLLDNAISNNGSRVFWTDLSTDATPENPAGKTRLFIRENDTQPQSPISGNRCTVPADACTTQLDIAQSGAEGPSGDGRFWTASDNGSRVFFTDCSRLTVDSTARPGSGCGEGLILTGNDLYEYDFEKPPGERLTDLTIDGRSADTLGADVQGVIGSSEDGSNLAFVADGVLTNGPNKEGREPVAGQPNLYLSHDRTTAFIATLAPTDNSFPTSGNCCQGAFAHSGDWRGDLGLNTAELAPNGHSVAFMSRLRLTGYDNSDTFGAGHFTEDIPEVFVYDDATGLISCGSCDPTGAPPQPSVELDENERGGYVTVSTNDTFNTRWLNSNGTEVFFNTSQGLVPQDTNHHQDVYEWESEGTGACGQAEGCVHLLSGGDTPHNASVIDASANGDDVFFTSRATLVPRAVGQETVQVYDARVGGGFPETSLACTGTGCQGVPPAPPIFATPSSATFNGIGNFDSATDGKAVTQKKKTAAQVRAEKLAKALKTCRKKPRRRRAACERQARRQYAPAKKKGKR